MFALTTKILIIDDFATMRKITKKALIELGYKNIEEADDGKTAFPMIEQATQSGKPYGFIICDWAMPGMSGIELLKAVRKHPSLKNTPFMLVAAESEQKNVVEAVQAGVNEYVVKPFNVNTMKAKLEAIYRRIQTKAA